MASGGYGCCVIGSLSMLKDYSRVFAMSFYCEGESKYNTLR